MDCTTILNWTSVGLNAIIAIAAVWAVISAIRSSRTASTIAAEATRQSALAVHEAHLNTQSQIASQLLGDYADPLMFEATNILRRWHKSHPDTQYTTDFDLMRFDANSGEPVDYARRRLAHYFQKAAVIVRNRMLDEPLLLEVISPNQVEFARRFVEPLDRVVTAQLHRTYDPQDYELLASLRKPEEPAWLNPDQKLKP